MVDSTEQGSPAPGRTRPRIRLAMAVVAGLLVACGFKPVGSLILLLIGLVLLIVALRGATIRLGALLGLVFGLAQSALLFSWVHVLGVHVWIILTIVEALYFPIFAVGFVLVARLRAWPLWGACVWVAVEYARGTFPLGGFPWGRLGDATIDTPLESYARLVGVPTLSGIVFAIAALAVYAWTRRSSRVAVGAVVAGLAATIVVGFALPVGTADPDKNIRVALIQGDVPGRGADGETEQRQVVDNHVDATLDLAADIRSGDEEQVDVVLWPENGSDLDPFTDPSVGAQIERAVRAVGVPVLVGAILDGPTADTRKNVGIAWDPQTGPGDTYQKRHLVPYGEYVPLRSFARKIDDRVDTEIPRDMLPGDDSGALRLGPVVVGDMLCFDVAYHDVLRQNIDDGAQMLVVQTNNSAYIETAQPDQQWDIARMRAIESGRYIAVPSINGVSGIADADGDVLVQGDKDVTQILTGNVETATGITPAIRFGGWLELVAGLLGIGAAVVAAAGQLRARRRTPGEGPTTTTAELEVRQ
ncbi:apolipoprotein N-acyltransferase [Solicola gregarius]|uniref:Apolipoprotein N-acyltransferase n=1 Tax=Solicola gregarius TaxID=2908642 RepID=A0AA46TH60_9ACTN|nr:apolipoprotein N-acyltransferase [Solicola gregarius]UYM05076.1 apolipoprotein N-acyltransferase [Solicola gregarius]